MVPSALDEAVVVGLGVLPVTLVARALRHVEHGLENEAGRVLPARRFARVEHIGSGVRFITESAMRTDQAGGPWRDLLLADVRRELRAPRAALAGHDRPEQGAACVIEVRPVECAVGLERADAPARAWSSSMLFACRSMSGTSFSAATSRVASRVRRSDGSPLGRSSAAPATSRGSAARRWRARRRRSGARFARNVGRSVSRSSPFPARRCGRTAPARDSACGAARPASALRRCSSSSSARRGRD